MADDGFHEIQLGKKQLVFLFMAAAVFSVVVFLIGVWVGRDVRRSEDEIAADVPAADVAADATMPPTQVSPDDLDYTARLQTDAAKGDGAKPASEAQRPAEPPVPVESAPPEPAPAAKSAAPVANPPQSANPLLQVGAFNDQRAAENLMNSLKAKGYAAVVFVAPPGPVRFKVRVGPFADRAEMNRISDRLKKEERLFPLVTR